jgi:alpha-tubulin suppressor-like RCC1 family protein
LRFRHVSAGGHAYFDLSASRDFGGYTCALSTEDRAYCWGDNRFGKLGNDGDVNSAVPRAVSGDRRYRQISAGETHACAVTFADLAYCWGRNLSGDLGDGTDVFRQRHPVPVAGGFQFSAVSAGDEHTCAVTATGAAYCWGGNADGQLGDGTTNTRRMPITVSGP